jgi:hypothetical protein
VGALDKVSLAASNIIASINMLVFMPVVGMGMGVLTLAGKYIGMRKPDVAVRVTHNGAKIAALYALGLGILFVVVPGLFVNIFGSGHSAEYAEILAASRPVMKVLAVFVFFDAIGMIYADALRGAGDTRFPDAGGQRRGLVPLRPGHLVHHAPGRRRADPRLGLGGLLHFPAVRVLRAALPLRAVAPHRHTQKVTGRELPRQRCIIQIWLKKYSPKPAVCPG